MSVNPEPEKTSQGRQGWLAKCGLIIPLLSSRERRESEEDATKPAMFEKMKRKRSREKSPVKKQLSTRSLRTSPRKAVASTGDVPTVPADAKAIFTQALADTERQSSHAERRREVLTQERQCAWDRRAREHASRDELDAAKILFKLREYERDVIFGNKPSEDIPGDKTLDMGGQFLTNKVRIEDQSRLYSIAKDLPKGALLHLHFNAELHPELLLEQARNMDTLETMFIRSTRPILNNEDLNITEMVFNVMPKDTPSTSIFQDKYRGAEWRNKEVFPDVWMRWSEFREKFNKLYGKEYIQKEKEPRENGSVRRCSDAGHIELEPAENWIKHKMVLSEQEAYDIRQTVNGVWARFNQATRCFKGLMNYERVFKWYIKNAIQRMVDEKVMYAELRPMLLDKAIPTNDGLGKLTHADQMKLILEGVREKQEELGPDRFLGFKIIYCTPRSIPKPMMQKEMQDCIDLKLQYPDLICGFDLVGAEDREYHIGYYEEELIAFQKTCEALKLDMPFLFHAGETLLDTGGSRNPENSNLVDAVVLKSKRIGHGYSLMKHPRLIEDFKLDEAKDQPGICVELCPISNELLHLCRNIKEHPYPQLLAAGIPCTVNSDNPSLFSNSMSHEFYQIMVGSPTITIHSWKQLIQWSLDYSCLSDEEKKHAHQIFNKDWNAFCEAIVADWGHIIAADAPDPYQDINKDFTVQKRAQEMESLRQMLDPVYGVTEAT